VKVVLTPKSNEELERFFKMAIIDYAKTIAKAYDLTNDRAIEIATKQTQQIRANKETKVEVFSIHDELISQPVGELWISLNPTNKKAFIYQITIFKCNRGKGYGKATLLQLEDYCKKLGYSEIKLSVFMNNQTAFRLYQKMDYKLVRAELKKNL